MVRVGGEFQVTVPAYLPPSPRHAVAGSELDGTRVRRRDLRRSCRAERFFGTRQRLTMSRSGWARAMERIVAKRRARHGVPCVAGPPVDEDRPTLCAAEAPGDCLLRAGNPAEEVGNDRQTGQTSVSSLPRSDG